MIDWSEVPQTCTKLAYQSRRAALESNRRKRNHPSITRPYLCTSRPDGSPGCGRWHLTSIRRPGDLFERPWVR